MKGAVCSQHSDLWSTTPAEVAVGGCSNRPCLAVVARKNPRKSQTVLDDGLEAGVCKRQVHSADFLRTSHIVSHFPFR